MQASFTRHRYELPILAIFAVIALIELLALHLLVSLWSSTVAWVLTALTMLMLGQMALLIHGLINRPTLIEDAGVTVRHGRRGEIFVPITKIASIENVAFQPEEKGVQTFRATVLAQPNVALRLSEPLVHGRRKLQSITMRLDQPSAFRAELSARLNATAE